MPHSPNTNTQDRSGNTTIHVNQGENKGTINVYSNCNLNITNITNPNGSQHAFVSLIEIEISDSDLKPIDNESSLSLASLLNVYFAPLKSYKSLTHQLYGLKLIEKTGDVNYPLWQIRLAYLATTQWHLKFKQALAAAERPHTVLQPEENLTPELAVARVLQHINQHPKESLRDYSGCKLSLQALFNLLAETTGPNQAIGLANALSLLITLGLRDRDEHTQREQILFLLKGEPVKLKAPNTDWVTTELKFNPHRVIRELMFIDFRYSCWTGLDLDGLKLSGADFTGAFFVGSQNLTEVRYACFHRVNAKRLTFKENADCTGSHWHNVNLSEAQGKAIIFEWSCFNYVTLNRATFHDAKTKALYKGEKNKGNFITALKHTLPEKEHSFRKPNKHTDSKRPLPDNVMQYAQHRAQWGLIQMHIKRWPQAIDHLTFAIGIFNHLPWLLHLGVAYAAYGTFLQNSELQDETLASQQYEKGIQSLFTAWALDSETVTSLYRTSPTINEKMLGIQDWKRLFTAFTLEHHQQYYTSLCNASSHTDDNPDEKNNTQCVEYLNFVKTLWPNNTELYNKLLNIPNTVGYRQSERIAYETLEKAICELANAATSHANKDTKLAQFRTTPQSETPNLAASLKTVYQDIPLSLHPDVIATLLDKEGRLRPLVSSAKKAMHEGIKSRHDVMRLCHRGYDIHIKAYPNFPAMDYAIDILNRRLIGHGSVPSTLAALVIEQPGKKPLRYPVLISLTEQGENLQTVLKHNEDELLATLDREAYTDLCLTELLKHPGDGFSRNYVVTTKTHSAGKTIKRLVSVDNDQMFVYPIVYGWFHQKIVQEKSIIYALPPFASHPMNPQALKRFASLNTDLILEKWLDSAGEMSDKYTSNTLFSKKEQKDLFENKDNKNNPITFALLFRKGVIAELAMNARYLRELANAWPEDKKSHYPRELLDRLNTRLCKLYDDARQLNKTEMTFFKATKAHESVTSRQALHAAGLKDIKTQEELGKWGQYKPSLAQQEIHLMHRHYEEKLMEEGHVNIRSEDTLGVYIDIGFPVIQDTTKKQINEKKALVEKRRQREIIKLLRDSKWVFKRLNLAGCVELTTEDLKTILKYSDTTLETLNITHCRQITNQALGILASFHSLRVIKASYTSITDVPRGGIFSFNQLLYFPQLNTLHLSGCGYQDINTPFIGLTHLALNTPELKVLKINNNPSLHSVELPHSIKLTHLNLEKAEQLEKLNLHKEAPLETLNLAGCKQITEEQLTFNSRLLSTLDLEGCRQLAQGNFRKRHPSLFTALPWQHYTISFVEKLSTTLQEALTTKGEATKWNSLPIQIRVATHDTLHKWGKFGQKIIPALISALKDKERDVHNSAAKALAQCAQHHKDSVIPALLTALKDYDPNIRSAAKALAQCAQHHKDSVIPTLLTALKDNNWHVRDSAAKALEQCHEHLSNHLDSVIPALLTALKDNQEHVRYSTAQALAQCHEHLSNHLDSVIPALLTALKDNNCYVRYNAAQALAQCHEHLSNHLDSVIPALLTALKDNNWDVRYSAAQALEQCHKHLSNHLDSVIPALLTALKDNNWHVRDSAAKALEQCAQHHKDFVIPALLTALKDYDSNVRDSAAKALEQCHEHLSNHLDSVIPTLLTALKDYDPNIRNSAAKALAQCHEHLSNHLDSVIPTLLIALKDYDPNIRNSAAKALAQCAQHHKDSIIPALLTALKDNNWHVRDSAAKALEQCHEHLSNHLDSVIPALLTALKDNQEHVRYSTAQALAQCHEHLSNHLDSVIPALLTALKGNQEHVRYSAAKALAQHHKDSVIPALLTALKDNNCYVRYNAAQALAQCHEHLNNHLDSVIPALLTALKDNQEHVRYSAAQALEQCHKHLSNHLDSVIPALLTALKGNNWNVRNSAAKTLAQCHEHLSNHLDSVIPALLTALKDRARDVRARDVRNSAAKALEQCAQHHKDFVIPALLTALKDYDSNVRNSAAKALEQCHEHLSNHLDSVIPALLTALKDKERDVGNSAAKALAQCHEHLSNHLDSVIPTLLTILKDNQGHVRYSAAQALEQCHEHLSNHLDSVIPALLTALKDNNWDVRDSAAKTLEQCHEHLSNHLDSVIPALLTALKDNNWDVRNNAAQALGTMGSVDTLQSWIKNIFNQNKANLESKNTFQQQPPPNNATPYSSVITQQPSSPPAEPPIILPKTQTSRGSYWTSYSY